MLLSAVMSLLTPISEKIGPISAHEIAAKTFLRLFNMKRVMTKRSHGRSRMLKAVMIGSRLQAHQRMSTGEQLPTI
jgi:hypothetical protein